MESGLAWIKVDCKYIQLRICILKPGRYFYIKFWLTRNLFKLSLCWKVEINFALYVAYGSNWINISMLYYLCWTSTFCTIQLHKGSLTLIQPHRSLCTNSLIFSYIYSKIINRDWFSAGAHISHVIGRNPIWSFFCNLIRTFTTCAWMTCL